MKKELKIGVIAREESATVEVELAGEARKRGHTYVRIPFQHVDITNAQHYFEGNDLMSYDILYYRTGIGYIWAHALEDFLHQHGRRAINLDISKHPYRYYKTQQVLTVAALGVKTPKTILNTTDEYQRIVTDLGDTFVVKADVSSQGRDVHLVHSEEEFKPFAVLRAEKEYFYQEYIPHDYDVRVHLVGGVAVATYKRVPVSGDFRTNVSRGSIMQSVNETIKKELYPLAERVGEALGLNICAVDFLERNTDGTFFFAEANLNPGWEISDKEATDVDMSALVIDYFERSIVEKNDKNVNIAR